MLAGPELPPLNPFAAELRRAAAGAAAPDKAPSLRELSKISGVGRSAIGDWLAGKSLPRSWDDGAVLVVDAIIKLAARYGKRFPDEEAVRQRCKDAYYSAKSAQPMSGTPGNRTPSPRVDATVGPVEAASRRAADDESGSAGSVPESGPAASSVGWWPAKYAISAVVAFAVLTATVALTLLWPAERPTYLVAENSEKCVTVDGDADEEKALQHSCTDVPGRMWYLRRAVEGGTVEPLYHIVNASNGKCLSYSEKIVGEAHVVVQRSCAGGNDEGQLWKFSKYGDSSDGWISGWMVNMYSSKCLDINGGDVAEGTPSYSGSTTED